MKKITTTITLEPDTTEYLQRVLADTGASEDRSLYINNLIRQDRERRGMPKREIGDDKERAPLSEAELLEITQEMEIPAAD